MLNQWSWDSLVAYRGSTPSRASFFLSNVNTNSPFTIPYISKTPSHGLVSRKMNFQSRLWLVKFRSYFHLLSVSASPTKECPQTTVVSSFTDDGKDIEVTPGTDCHVAKDRSIATGLKGEATMIWHRTQNPISMSRVSRMHPYLRVEDKRKVHENGAIFGDSKSCIRTTCGMEIGTASCMTPSLDTTL